MSNFATSAELERAIAVVAMGVLRHGDAYMPVLERLQAELAALDRHNDTRSRATAALHAMMQRRATNASAL